MYLLYLYDRRIAAKNNGWGPIHTFVDKVVADGMDPMVQDAQIEEQRQRMKKHYELSQRPIYRTSFPEYVAW